MSLLNRLCLWCSKWQQQLDFFRDRSRRYTNTIIVTVIWNPFPLYSLHKPCPSKSHYRGGENFLSKGPILFIFRFCWNKSDVKWQSWVKIRLTWKMLLRTEEWNLQEAGLSWIFALKYYIYIYIHLFFIAVVGSIVQLPGSPSGMYSNITVMDIHGWSHLSEINFHRHGLAFMSYNTWNFNWPNRMK
jgi:hypothetical protein